MKLKELNPRFVGSGGAGITDLYGNPVPVREKIGLSFECPCGKCGRRLFTAFENPPDGKGPTNPDPPHPNWHWNGQTDFDQVTLFPSIKRLDGCQWHGWIRDGAVLTA